MQRGARVLAAVSVMMIAGGLGCAVAGAIPFDVVQPLGRHIRRAEDVTPERHARLVHICLAFAAFGIGAGLLLWRRRSEAAAFLGTLFRDLRTALRGAPAVMRSWGLMVWALFALGISLRAMHLNDSMAYDESYTFNNLARQSLVVGIADYNSTNNHLLNTLLMHVSWRLFGAAEWALRLPVFLIGALLLPLVWIWASRWAGRPTAMVTLALIAVSPFLITYSTDARGYIMVTAAAIALDDAAARLFASGSSRPLAWLQCVLAAALGLCAMPIMLYAIVSVLGWVIVRTTFQLGDQLVIGVPESGGPAAPRESRIARATTTLKNSVHRNLWPIIAGLLLFGLIVATMYSPAYIFRGRAAMGDQILNPIPLSDQPAEQWRSLVGAWTWWTTGFPPPWAWLIGLILGIVFFRSTWADRIRWLALPLSMLVLHLIGRVAAPPRVFILMLPSVALLTAAGWIAGIPGRGRHARGGGLVLAAIIAIGGTVYAFRNPVLIYPEERTSFVSVREAMTDLKSRIAAEPAQPHRLIAPLPCDLPAIFYRDRENISVEINGVPQRGEVVWVLTRHGETPAQVLASPLIHLPEFAGSRPPFEEVARFRTLILHRSPAAP